MSTGGLSERGLRRMHAVMSAHVERGDVPGLVTLVSRRGEVHVDAVGTTAAGGGGGEAMAADTIFRISSMTKPVTAVATLVLLEECAFRLDEPVDRLLPELADRRVLRRLDSPLSDAVPADRPVTVRDLLTFTMGLGSVLAAPGTYPIQAALVEQLNDGPPSPQAAPDPDEWMRRLGELPLVAQPGERWMYNTSADVLGVLVARAAGMPLEAFLRERIFEPLGMIDTGFSVPGSKLTRFGPSYWTDPATSRLGVYDEAEGLWSRPPKFASGAGGLVSTAVDYAAFGEMLLNGGKRLGAQILSRPTIELMTADQLSEGQKAGAGLLEGYFESHGWGFGVSVVTKRRDLCDSVGKYGWDGGMGTSWYSDPREDMVTILMTPRMWTSPEPPGVLRDFWTLAYAAIED